MSLEAASKWFYFIHDSANKALFDELQEIDGVDARIAFAKTKGYEFTIEEFTQAASEAWDSATVELSDEQLEGVSGGGFSQLFDGGLPSSAACYASTATYNVWQAIKGNSID